MRRGCCRCILVWVAVWICCALPGEGKAEHLYSLQEIFARALEGSETVGISVEDLFIARQTRRQAFSVLMPEISAFGSYTRYGLQDNTSSFFAQPDSTTRYGLTAGQQFTLNGKELIGLKVTEQTIEKQGYSLADIRASFLYEVAVAFFDVLKGEKARDIASASAVRLEAYRKEVSARIALEEAPKTDMLRTQAELAKARADLTAAENRLTYARRVLAQLADLPDNFKLASVIPMLDPTLSHALPRLKDVARTQRDALKAAAVQERIAANEVRYYRSDYWPSLSLEGNYARTQQDPGDGYTPEESLSVSLSVNLPLFDAGLRSARIDEAKARHRKARLALRSMEEQVDLEVEEAYLAVCTARKVAEALTEQVTYALANYEAVRRQFSAGTADSVDVVDANTLLVTAERELTEARYTHQMAIIGLERVQGVFAPKIETFAAGKSGE